VGDYVTMIVSPALIMALVGSLIFFLLEILYVGAFTFRLHWTFSCFIFAAVLIARIAITYGRERAGLYALALGVVVWIALQCYLELPPEVPLAGIGWLVNALLMALIWWCADRLTWDCTYLDEQTDPGGAGLLEAARLESLGIHIEPETGEEGRRKSKPKSVRGGSRETWWQRYQQYQEKRASAPHTPGVWVVYFSLAALPLFGLGQVLIPAQALERRRYTFQLLVVYVTAALGLLLTTCYLGLRRYLRHRKLRMPVRMTAVWLIAGTLLVGILLIGSAVLPRPQAEYPLRELVGMTSPQRDASRYATMRDSGTRGEGRPGEGAKANDSTKGSGAKDGQREGNQGKDGGSTGSKKDDQGGDGKSGRGSGQGSGSGSGSGQGSGQGKGSGQSQGQEPGGRNSPAASPPPVTFLTPLFNVLKWLVFAVLAIAVALTLLGALLKFLANFTLWAERLLAFFRDWWSSFGSWSRSLTANKEDQPAQAPPRRPFSSYRNPFVNDEPLMLSPMALVRYTFDALEAWGAENGCERRPDETPLEFADRLVVVATELSTLAPQLAALFARCLYARHTPNRQDIEIARQLWECLDQSVAGAREG
jgi:hypothetical protein